jgi:hypothetical protein
MGENRRYGGGIERGLDEWLIRAEPVSLTAEELRTAGEKVTRPEHGVPVQAWVRFHESSIQPAAEAVAWTDRAVLVRFTLRDGRVREAWVWAGAVTRR